MEDYIKDQIVKLETNAKIGEISYQHFRECGNALVNGIVIVPTLMLRFPCASSLN